MLLIIRKLFSWSIVLKRWVTLSLTVILQPFGPLTRFLLRWCNSICCSWLFCCVISMVFESFQSVRWEPMFYEYNAALRKISLWLPFCYSFVQFVGISLFGLNDGVPFLLPFLAPCVDFDVFISKLLVSINYLLEVLLWNLYWFLNWHSAIFNCYWILKGWTSDWSVCEGTEA